MRGWLVLVVLLGLIPEARADDASEARFFDGQARRAFEQDDFRTALDRFLLAYTAAPSAPLAYNVGVCADLAGEPRVAFTYLARYLSSTEDNGERRSHAESVTARLRPQLRIVSVRSEPPGATIFLDNTERGAFGRTPMDVALEPGEEHTLLLHHDGYLPAEEVVASDAPSETEVSVRMQPRMGSVRIEVSPERARVTFIRDGDVMAEHEGDGRIELPVGRYRVRVEASLHGPSERLLVVAEGELAEQTLLVELTAMRARTCLLLVSAGGIAGRVIVDDRPVGRLPLRLLGVAPGPHTIVVEADDGREWRGEAELTAGAARHVQARPR